MFFPPISLFLILFIVILIPLLFILIPLRVVEAAFGRLGIPAPIAFLLLLTSLVGSLINIPIIKSSAPAKPWFPRPTGTPRNCWRKTAVCWCHSATPKPSHVK